MRICHFEDKKVLNLEPLSLTRPVFELRSGMCTLAQKQRRYFQADTVGALLRPYLEATFSQDNSNILVNDYDWLQEQSTLLINARWLPPVRSPKIDAKINLANGPFVGMVDDEIAYAYLTTDELSLLNPQNLSLCMNQWSATLMHRPAGGRMVHHLWDLVETNAEQIALDFQAQKAVEQFGRPGTLTLTGPSDWLRVDPTARIDPFVVADTNNGPVVIERDAVITSFTRLEGPCWIGPRSHILGANIRSGSSIGPNCRMSGEVECSIIQGNSNKYHDGFLGHSYLGEWVNLGAGTHTSDLRNDYGEVKTIVNGVYSVTGRRKVGSFIGDHSKTGLGSLINTGANIGIFVNLLPAGHLLPKFVPSFCWVEHGRVIDGGDLPALFATAIQVMERRGEEFTENHRLLFQHLHEQTSAIRRQHIQESELRRLRRSA